MSDTDQIRVGLVDDQALVRTGFAMVIDSQDDMKVVMEASNGRIAIDRLGVVPVDVILMDIRMPRLNGVVATEAITAATSTKVLVLTTFDLDEYVYSALQAGASGFLLKDAGPAELLAAIRAVASGEAVVAPSATRRLLERFIPTLPPPDRSGTAAQRLAALTEREREVLGLVGQGLNNSEIAGKLFLSEATIKTHVGHVLTKLGLRDRVHMVVFAYDAGLVRPRG